MQSNNTCLKELTCQHELSPGVVEEDELIGLILLHPDQWDGGDFTKAAFSRKRLKAGQLSVCRVKYTTQCEVRQFVICPQIEKNPSRTLVGVASAECSKLRSVVTASGERAVCVIDAPVFGNDLSDKVCDCITSDYLGHAHLEFSSEMTGNDNYAVLMQIKRAFSGQSPKDIEDVFPSCRN